MAEKIDLSELQNLTVDEIAEKVPTLAAEQLAELRSLESPTPAEGRKGVLAAQRRYDAQKSAKAA